jgi:hypothetical protein
MYNVAYRIFINSLIRYLRVGHTSSPEDGWLQDYLGQAMFGANSAVAVPGVINTGCNFNGFDPASSTACDAFKNDYALYAPQIEAILREALTFYNVNLALECDLLKKIDVESQYLFADADNPTAVVSTFRHMTVVPNNDDDNGVTLQLFTSGTTQYANTLITAYQQLESAWGSGSKFGMIRADLAHTYGEGYGYKAPDISIIYKPFTAICDNLFNAMLSNINAPTAMGKFDTANQYALIQEGHLANTIIASDFANLLTQDFSNPITGIPFQTLVAVSNGTGVQDISLINSVWQDLINVFDDDCFTGGKLAEIVSLHGSLRTVYDTSSAAYTAWWDHGVQTVLRMDILGDGNFTTDKIARGVSRLGTNIGDATSASSAFTISRNMTYWNACLTFIDNAPIVMHGSYSYRSSGTLDAIAVPRYNVEALGLIPLETLDAITVGSSASLLRAVR